MHGSLAEVTSSASANVVISNRLGLHARPAMVFVEVASRYGADIRVRRTDGAGGVEAVDGKSIMQTMMLAATQRTELAIDADGEDACDAIEALRELVDSRFGED